MSKKAGSGISVVHVIDSGGYGGGERYLFDLVRNASGEVRHAAIIPCPGPLARRLEQAGIPYAVTKMPPWFSPRAVLGISRMIRARCADIIHSHGYRANIYARAAAALAGAASVCTVHISLFDYIDTPWWKKSIYMAVERFSSSMSRCFICISSAMEKDTLRLGVDEQKIVVIPNGVDLERFHPKMPDPLAAQRLGVSKTGPVIGTVGRMVNEKGQVYLIDALPELQEKFPDLTCLVVGDGPLLPYLKQRAASIGVFNACIFAGTHENMEDIYPLMDVFILPSLREPFGLVLLEAMACGIPVVATDAGGPRDFISSGKNGILVPPADSWELAAAVSRLLLSPDTRKKLSVSARRKVKKEFNIHGTVFRIEEVYRAVTARFLPEGA